MLLNVYCTRRDLPPLAFRHLLRGRRDRTDRELAELLNGFTGFVVSGNRARTGRRPTRG